MLLKIEHTHVNNVIYGLKYKNFLSLMEQNVSLVSR